MFGCSDKNDLPQKKEVLSSEKISVEVEDEKASEQVKNEPHEEIEESNITISIKDESTDTENDNNESIDQSWYEKQENTVHKGDVVYPYIAPDTKNIAENIFDASFESLGQNISFEGASVNTRIARTGVQSILLDEENDTLSIKNISVEEGQWYVISGYMYTEKLPANVIRYYAAFMHYEKQLDIPTYPVVGISKAKQWEEFILPVYIKKDLNITDIKLVIRNTGAADSADNTEGAIYIDDITIHHVQNSAALYGMTKPASKQTFDGALVRVDALGNMSINQEDEFKPFIPIVVYPGGDMAEWGKYKKKGFNTILCNNPQEAKMAVKLGMHWIWDFYGYGIYENDESGYQRFEKEYWALRNSDPEVFKKLLYFYWDNERYRLFDSLKKFSDFIHKFDVNKEGIRYRPFLMQLSFSTANPHYSNDSYSLVDLQGLYANPMIFEDNDPQNYQGIEFKGDYDGEFANFAIFENIPGVKIPKTVFVINSPFGDKHLANTIFAAFARGGKGFAYWKDGGSQPKIESKLWWKNFDQTTRQIESLMPLLLTPHWTEWKLNVSLADDEDGMVVGTRDFGDKRCMITASRSSKSEKVRFSGLDTADDTAVIDYFSGKKIASWKDGAFEITFAPRGYGVYCW